MSDDDTSPQGKGERFRRLHAGPDLLLLPNAWDAGTAAVMAAAGFPAIATTSAGIAFAHGCADGERLDRGLMLAAVRRIAARVAVPVTADLETGYGAGPAEVGETIRLVIEAGAVGVNLEDGSLAGDEPLLPAAAMAERLAAARAAADASGVPFTLNARIDTFLRRRNLPGEANFEETLRRATSYLAAGADCIFVPWVSEAAMVGRLVAAIAAPLNVLGAMAGTPAPALPELLRLGVRRVSIGGSLAVAMLSRVDEIARAIRERGSIDYDAGGLTNASVSRLLAAPWPGGEPA